MNRIARIVSMGWIAFPCDRMPTPLPRCSDVFKINEPVLVLREHACEDDRPSCEFSLVLSGWLGMRFVDSRALKKRGMGR